jgi:hypothetical protein
MAAKKRRKRSKTGRRADRETIVAALALAVTQGDVAAARAFGLCRRTLQRYKAAAKADPGGQLAQAIAKARTHALRQVDDLLTQTWEDILRRLQELLPQATMPEVNDAAKTIGELRLTREALGVDEPVSGYERNSNDREGEAATSVAGRAPSQDEIPGPEARIH